MALPPEIMPTPEGALDPEQVGEAMLALALTLPEMELAEVAELVVEVASMPTVEPDDDDYVQPVWPNRWTIESRGAAEWAMRHLAAAEARRAAYKAERDEYVRQLDVFLAERSRPLEATEAFMRAHLERWGLLMREQTTEATQALPSGVVRTSQQKTAVAVPKGAPGKDARLAIVRWAIEEGLLDVVNPDVYVTKLREIARPVRIVRYELACGHGHPDAIVDYDAWTPDLYAPGKMVWCAQGNHERIVVKSDVREAVVTTTNDKGLGFGGVEIPGAVVDPAHLTVSVSPK